MLCGWVVVPWAVVLFQLSERDERRHCLCYPINVGGDTNESCIQHAKHGCGSETDCVHNAQRGYKSCSSTSSSDESPSSPGVTPPPRAATATAARCRARTRSIGCRMTHAQPLLRLPFPGLVRRMYLSCKALFSCASRSKKASGGGFDRRRVPFDPLALGELPRKPLP